MTQSPAKPPRVPRSSMQGYGNSSGTRATKSATPSDGPGGIHGRPAVLGRYWPALLLLILFITFTLMSPGFISQANWLSTSVYASSLVPLAIGQMLVMLTGGIDLSMAGVAAFSAMASALIFRYFDKDRSSLSGALLVLGICMVIGALAGLFNGLLITRLNLSPFIVTLGTLEILSGGVNVLNNGSQQTITSDPLISFGTSALGGWIPLVVIVSVALMAGVGIWLAKTRFGMRTYALGSNPEAGRRLGIPTDRIITTQYVLSGILSGVAGLFLLARFSQASTSVDTAGMLTAIAAVVIGGTSLSGGSGTMIGTLVGVGIVSILLPGLVLSGLSSYWQLVFTGLVIIAAISIQSLRGKIGDGLRRRGRPRA